jgi:hypothetical protein
MSTYALDCLEMGRNKTITKHTDAELNLWVRRAADRFGSDFWLMLHGVDAYMERRRRRIRAVRERRADDLRFELFRDLENDRMWGK